MHVLSYGLAEILHLYIYTRDNYCRHTHNIIKPPNLLQDSGNKNSLPLAGRL